MSSSVVGKALRSPPVIKSHGAVLVGRAMRGVRRASGLVLSLPVGSLCGMRIGYWLDVAWWPLVACDCDSMLDLSSKPFPSRKTRV